MAEIRLISDGTKEGTNLYVNGERIGGIQKLVWELDIRAHTPYPVITAVIAAPTIEKPYHWEESKVIYQSDVNDIEIEHLSQVYELGSRDAIGLKKSA